MAFAVGEIRTPCSRSPPFVLPPPRPLFSKSGKGGRRGKGGLHDWTMGINPSDNKWQQTLPSTPLRMTTSTPLAPLEWQWPRPSPFLMVTNDNKYTLIHPTTITVVCCSFACVNIMDSILLISLHHRLYTYNVEKREKNKVSLSIYWRLFLSSRLGTWRLPLFGYRYFLTSLVRMSMYFSIPTPPSFIQARVLYMRGYK